MQIPRYSNLPLAGKILVPTLSIFLGIWTTGAIVVGYIATRAQVNGLRQETQNTAIYVAHEFEAARKLLKFKAKSIADILDLSPAVVNKDQQALLRTLLPLQSRLELDLVKVIDHEGKVLSDLRSTTVGQVPLQDSSVIRLAQSGLVFTSLVISEDLKIPFLVEVISIKSREAVVGSVIVGYAITPELLRQNLKDGRQQIFLLQDSEAIASTFSVNESIRWSEIASTTAIQEIQIDGEPYFTQPVNLPQIADDRFQAVVLTPLTSLQKSQQQIWLVIGGVGLIGGAIVSVISFGVTHWVTRRIAQLTKATQDLAAGNLKARLEVNGNDEVALLATSFNDMAEQLNQRDRKIQTQLYELERLVTELQQMPQLIQTEKMAGLGQMVAGVAHEINNPVSFIYGNVPPAKAYVADLIELLNLYQQHFPHPPFEIQKTEAAIEIDFVTHDLPKLLDSIESGALRIREIVLSLRNFSRKDEAVMKDVNLHDGIDSTLIILGHRLKAQSHRPSIEVIKDYGCLPSVYCFAGEINQVFMNLLSNAIDALEENIDQRTAALTNPQSPNLQIRIQTDVINDDWVIIRIADNGPGIAEDIRNRLFDPFFTTKVVGKGTGLGLSISYQIVVEKHGGKLWCESNLGQGAEFIIQIPIAPKSHLLPSRAQTYS